MADENTDTIISSFPKRWGKNRADSSAVHKSIRTRLKAARKDEIRTVFDLALIIVDQCSRVFFDRSRMNDRQPNLVEAFTDAIRGVVSSPECGKGNADIFRRANKQPHSINSSPIPISQQKNTTLVIKVAPPLLKTPY